MLRVLIEGSNVNYKHQVLSGRNMTRRVFAPFIHGGQRRLYRKAIMALEACVLISGSAIVLNQAINAKDKREECVNCFIFDCKRFINDSRASFYCHSVYIVISLFVFIVIE